MNELAATAWLWIKVGVAYCFISFVYALFATFLALLVCGDLGKVFRREQ